MSSEDEKAALQARLYDCIKGKDPGWQDASLSSFLLKAGELPAPEYEITSERVPQGGPTTTPPVIYLPSAVTSEADTAAGPGPKAGNAVRSAATLSGYINASEKSLSVPEASAIGRGVDTGELLSISDTARRSGLYVLGRSGSGKTELLKRMILSDIDRGHGVFFIDPHGDAIDDLITRVAPDRLADVIWIDPDHETHSFGITLLSCADIRSWKEREATYNRAKAVFDKLWKNMPEDLPWLQLIIEHTLPVFIYNPEYTLAEMPRFYRDAEFRRLLLRNVTQDPPRNLSARSSSANSYMR